MRAAIKRRVDEHLESMYAMFQELGSSEYMPTVVTMDDKGTRVLDFLLEFTPERKQLCTAEAMGLAIYDPGAEALVMTVDALTKPSDVAPEEEGYLPPSLDPESIDCLVTLVFFQNAEGEWDYEEVHRTYSIGDGGEITFDPPKGVEIVEAWGRAKEEHDIRSESWMFQLFSEIIDNRDQAPPNDLGDFLYFLHEHTDGRHGVALLREDIATEIEQDRAAHG